MTKRRTGHPICCIQCDLLSDSQKNLWLLVSLVWDTRSPPSRVFMLQSWGFPSITLSVNPSLPTIQEPFNRNPHSWTKQERTKQERTTDRLENQHQSTPSENLKRTSWPGTTMYKAIVSFATRFAPLQDPSLRAGSARSHLGHVASFDRQASAFQSHLPVDTLRITWLNWSVRCSIEMFTTIPVLVGTHIYIVHLLPGGPGSYKSEIRQRSSFLLWPLFCLVIIF